MKVLQHSKHIGFGVVMLAGIGAIISVPFVLDYLTRKSSILTIGLMGIIVAIASCVIGMVLSEIREEE